MIRALLGLAILLCLLVGLSACATGHLRKSHYCGPNAGKQDFAEREVTLDGVRLHVHEAGQGDPPVLLVHGFGGTMYSWRNLIGPLSRSHRVVAFDLPGHGYSERREGYDYSAIHLGELTRKLLRQEGMKDVVIIGNSYGGAISAAVVVEEQEERGASGGHQDLVGKMVLIDAAGYRQKMPAHVGMLRIPVLKHVVPAIVPPRLLIRFIVRAMYAVKSRVESEQIREYANAFASKGTRRAYRSYVKVILPEGIDEYVKKYREIEVPTLIIEGRKDRVVPVKVAERFHEDIPGSRLVMIEDAGHIPQEETPAKVLAALGEFLGEDLLAAR